MNLHGLLREAIAAADREAVERSLPAPCFRFGDLVLAIRVHGDALAAKLLRMIAARTCGPSLPAFRLDVVGGRFGCDALLPPRDVRGETVVGTNSEIYYLWLDQGGGYLTALDRRSRRGLIWFTAPDRIASWHTARPFLHAIRGLSRDTSWTPIHAAAVAKNGKGVVAVGQSGAGKTGIGIGCALAGWEYLGDDAVLVRAGPPRVGALYNSARLRCDMLHVFPRAMTASLGLSDDVGELKAEIDMSTLGCCGTSEAELRAIVFPLPAGDGTPRITPLGRADALRRLMEAARLENIRGAERLEGIRRDESVEFGKLAAVVDEVPCFTMSRCHDPAALTRLFADLSGAEQA